jgi:hypothetical protein
MKPITVKVKANEVTLNIHKFGEIILAIVESVQEGKLVRIEMESKDIIIYTD